MQDVDNPFSAPHVEESAREIPGSEDAARLRELGLAQRLVQWAILASIVSALFPILYLLALPFLLYSAFRLARAAYDSVWVAVIFLPFMFIPLISVLGLLSLTQRASKKLREAGIRIGFMGARLEDLPPVQV